MVRHAALTAAAWMAIACTSSEEYAGDITPASIAVIRAPTAMMPGDKPDTITVQVRGHIGPPAPGHVVTWSTTEPQAAITALDSVTDLDGHARALFSPGGRLGVQPMSASVGISASISAVVSVRSGTWTAIAGTSGRFCGVGPSGTLSCTETLAESTRQHVLGTVAYTDITGDTDGTFCAARAGGVDCFTWRSSVPAPPQPVPGVTRGFTSLSGENGVYCGLDEAGAAWCWGNNQFGRLGTGDERPSQVALQVLGGTTFREISVAFTHACALAMNGDVWCWGNNQDAQLGLPEDQVRVRPPRRIEGLPPSSSHATMASVSCALGVDRIVRCWGNDSYGTLGRGGRRSAPWNDPVPAPIARVGAARGLTGTGHGFAVIDHDGRMHAWGRVLSSSGVNVPAPILLLEARTSGFVTQDADWMACARHVAPDDGVVCLDTRKAMMKYGFENVPAAAVRAFHGLPPSP